MMALHPRRLLLALRRAARAPLARAAWFAATALVLTWPLFASAGELNEFRDAQFLYNYEDVAVRTVRQFFELPLWNPYYCGGMYGLGTPQSRFASPPFLLSLLFGPLRSQPLIAFAMAMVGMEGFFRYASMRSASALGPALIAPLFAGNGWMAFSYFSGWVHFYGFLLLPWILYGCDLLLRGRREGPLVIGVAYAFIIGFAGTYAAPLGSVLMVAHLARALLERPRLAHRPLRQVERLAFAALVVLGLSAFRLWPVAESMYSAPRLMGGTPGETYELFSERLFRLAAPRSGNYGREGQHYVGLALVPLCLLGVLRKRAIAPIVLGLLFAWLATGYAYPTSAFAALRKLPLFEMLRYPERFLLLACLFAYEVAAYGVDRWTVWSRKRPGLSLGFTLLSIALTLVSVRQLTQNTYVSARGMWTGSAPIEVERPFKQARGNRWLASYYPSISRGSIECMEAYPVPMSALLRGDLPAEEYLLEPDAGSVERRDWSPNQIELQVELQRPARLLINQNYHTGWRSSVGEVVAHDALLAVDLPAGKHELTLRFLPRSAVFGALVSLAALIAGLAYARSRARATVVAAIAIPLLAACSLLYGEPFPEKPAPQNADGTPLLAEGLPDGAKPLAVQFAAPVKLEGVVAPGTVDEVGIARFELAWRVLGEVPWSVGVSVHFESSKGRFVASDHHVIGASTFFDRAPRGVLLRDAFGVNLGRDPEEHWKMFVCLWHAAGDGSRMRILHGGGVPLDRDRALVAEF